MSTSRTTEVLAFVAFQEIAAVSAEQVVTRLDAVSTSEMERGLQRFDTAWAECRAGAGVRPALGHHLPAKDHPQYREWVLEAIRIDLEHRLKNGDAAPLVTDYFHLEGLVLSPGEQIELIGLEYQGRWDRGEEGVSRRQYLDLFPQHGVELERGLKLRWNCPHCNKEGIELTAELATSATCPRCGETSSCPPPARADSITFPPMPREQRGFPEVPNFRILRKLGQGGMGIVYLAEDLQLKRRVALKVMHTCLSDQPAQRERFLREGRAMASIKHEHVVAIYQVGEQGNTQYLAMELLEGEPLEATIERGPLPPGEVMRIGHEAALALAAVHERGLIHRDVKPANIWLEAPAGKVKLLDFGLVRDRDSNKLTCEGMIVGTLAYMSPEQARGNVPDARSDLFSLGCVLYQLATGRQPFCRQTPLSILEAVTKYRPHPPQQLNPEVSPALSALVMQLLEKTAAHRPASADEVATDLATLRQEALSTPLIASRRRRLPWLVAVSVLLLGVAMVAVLLSGVFDLNAPEPPNRDEVAPLALLYASDIPSEERFAWQPAELRAVLGTHARRHWEGMPALVSHPAEKWVASTSREDSRLCFWDPDKLQLMREVALPNSPPDVLALSPDGRTLALGYHDCVLLYDVSGPTAVEKRRLGEPAGELAWRPDSRGLACVRDRVLWIVDLMDAEPKVTRLLHGGDYLSPPVFTGDGKILACGTSETGKVLLWDLSGPKPRELPPLEDGKKGVRSVAASPLGRLLAVWSVEVLDGSVDRLVDLSGAAPKQLPLALPVGARTIAFAANGKTLAIGNNGWVRVWDLADGGLRERTTLTTSGEQDNSIDVDAMAFASDGRRLIVAGYHGVIRGFDVTSPEAIERPTLAGPPGRVRMVAFSPSSGKMVVRVGPQFIRLWDLKGGRPRLQTQLETRHYESPFAVELDCRRAVIADGGRMTLWDMTQETPNTLNIFQHSEKIASILYTPDGKRVFTGCKNGEVTVWDVSENRFVSCGRAIFPQKQESRRMVLSPDGRTLAFTNKKGGNLMLVDVRGNEPKAWRNATLPADDLNSSPETFSSDGKLLTLVGEPNLPLIALDKPEPACRVQFRTDSRKWFTAAVFSPDGKTLVTADAWHRGVRFWDVPTEKDATKLTKLKMDLSPWAEWKFPGVVSSLAVSSCGKYVATGNGNGTVYVLVMPERPAKE